MRSERKKITCSVCCKEFSARIITQVDLGRPEDRDANLADGSLFTFRCPNCGAEMRMNHYLLWVDEGHTVAVCNVTCEEEKAAMDEALSALTAFGRENHMRRRFVSSPAHLCEKAEIFSSGLDDRVVEIIKLYLAEDIRRSHPTKVLTDVLFFPNGEDYGVLFVCPDGDLSVTVTRAQMVDVSAHFHFTEPSPTVVDAAWARTFLTKGGMKC